MKNHKLVKNFGHEKALEERYEAIEDRILKLQEQKWELSELIGEVRDITEIYKGVALHIEETNLLFLKQGGAKITTPIGNGVVVEALGDDIRRGAYVYKNAEDKKWVMLFIKWDENALKQHMEVIGRWTTKKKCVETAKDYVAKNTENW